MNKLDQVTAANRLERFSEQDRSSALDICVIMALLALAFVIVHLALAGIEYRRQIGEIAALTHAAVQKGYVCRVSDVDGVKVEHCIRTLGSQ